MDTLKIADRLEQEGVFPGDKARAFARIMADAAQSNLTTKADLDGAVKELRAILYRALFIQFLAIIGVVTAIVKL